MASEVKLSCISSAASRTVGGARLQEGKMKPAVLRLVERFRLIHVSCASLLQCEDSCCSSSDQLNQASGMFVAVPIGVLRSGTRAGSHVYLIVSEA